MDAIIVGGNVWITKRNEVIGCKVKDEVTSPDGEKSYNLIRGDEEFNLVNPSFIYTNKKQASRAVLRTMGELP